MNFKQFNTNIRNALKRDSQFANGVIVGETKNIFGEKAYNVKIVYGNNLIPNYSSQNSEVLTGVVVQGLSNEETSLEEGDNVVVTFLGKDSNNPIIIGGSTQSSTGGYVGVMTADASSQEGTEETEPAEVDTDSADSKTDGDSSGGSGDKPVTPPSGDQSPKTGWGNPFLSENWRITTHYRKPGNWKAGYHTGVDFAATEGAGVCEGRTIVAACGGKVITAGWGGSYGNYVVIDHSSQGTAVFTLYAHMQDNSLAVSAGNMVSTGQALGKCGNTGNSYGAHLHFEVRTENNYNGHTDPLKYIPFSGA